MRLSTVSRTFARSLLIIPLALAVSGSPVTGCISQAKYQQVVEENTRLQQRVDNLKAKAEARVKALKDLLEDLKPLVDRGLLSVELVDGRVTIGMTSDVLFASGSAVLSADGKRNVGDLASALKRRHLQQDFQIEGHTDNEPITSAEFPDNWHLGAARAITVLEYMVDQGFPTGHISASTFGATQPVSPNNSERGKADNRRIEIVVLPDLNDLPGSKQLIEAMGKAPRPRGGR